MAGGYFPISIAGSNQVDNVVLADPVLSRELKSLQEELRLQQRQRPVQSADRRIESEVQTTTGSDTVASGGTAATVGSAACPLRERRLCWEPL